MLEVTDAGGIVVPPVPNFKDGTDKIDDIVTETIRKSPGFIIDASALLTDHDGLWVALAIAIMH